MPRERPVRTVKTSPLRVAFVVYANWRTGGSGVTTFIHSIRRLLEGDAYDAQMVEIPYDDAPARGRQAGGTRRVAAATPGRGTPQHLRRPSHAFAARLALGYAKMVVHDVARVLRRHRQLRGRILLCNRFGCETLPIALRLVFPFGRIVAVCHTHPTVDSRTGHSVRRAVERTCYACVSDIIFNSKGVRAEWRKKLGVRSIRGTVILHGLEKPDSLPPGVYPERSPDCIDFVCVARFVYWKGHKELLRAWKRALCATHQRIRLILVGDGPTVQENMQLSKDLGFSVCDLQLATCDLRPATYDVIFLGSRDNGAGYFRAGDVAILLSTEAEAFGFVLLEAMSCGRPLIGSRLGGIPEVVADGHTGLLVDPMDVSEVAGAICRLAESPAEATRMGDNGRERWRREFSLERMLGEYDAYFKETA